VENHYGTAEMLRAVKDRIKTVRGKGKEGGREGGRDGGREGGRREGGTEGNTSMSLDDGTTIG
jgi:hypothetical protein